MTTNNPTEQLPLLKQPNIFDFECFADFCTAIYLWRKKMSKKFTLRRWAKSCGFTSAGYLSNLLKKVRPFQLQHLEMLKPTLSLCEEQLLFAHLLIKKEHCSNIFEQQAIISQLRDLQENPVTQLQRDEFAMVNDWYHMVILEMFDLPDFQFNPAWIAKKLKEPVPEFSIEMALKRLLRLGLICKNEKGAYVKSKKILTYSSTIADQAIQKYHNKSIQLAQQALTKDRVEQRDFSATTLCIRKQDLTKVKELIREFQQKIYEVNYTEKNQPCEILRVNTQAFFVTE